MAKVCVEFDADGGTPAAPVRTYSTTIGDGTTTAFDVIHNFNTRDVLYTLRDLSTGDLDNYDVGVNASATDRLALTFATPPAAASVRVSVLAPPAAV